MSLDYIPEKIIGSEDYTDEIVEIINALRYQARQIDTEIQDDDIIVVEYDSVIYVLANPILSWDIMEIGDIEYCLHEWTLVSKNQRSCSLCHELQLARYNITFEYLDGPKLNKVNDQSGLSIECTITAPRLIILCPDLCARIEKDGTVKYGDQPALKSAAATNHLHFTIEHLLISLDRLETKWPTLESF